MTETQTPYFRQCLKEQSVQNKDYENFVRKQGEVFHHESSLPDAEKKMGGKCSSYYGVSLPVDKHRKRESPNSGFITFWADELGFSGYGLTDKELRNFIIIELQRIVIKNLVGYIEKKRGRK